MAILQSIDYSNSKFERFSNVADEISTTLLANFLECEVLVAVPDRYDFEFLIRAAERKRRTEYSTHMQKIEIIDNQKCPKSFQSYLENNDNRNNISKLVKYLFWKWRGTLPSVLTSFQTNYLVNLDGVTNRWTS